MAGTSYFNAGGSGNGSGSPYPKLITSPNPHTTNLFGGEGAFLNSVTFLHYAHRAGAGNRGLRVLGETSVSLISVSTTGAITTVSNFDPTSYLPNALIQPQTICYSSVDQCWYILLTYVNPLHCRLIKVNDTTGVVTAIGAGFNPANPNTSWPSATNGHILTSFYLDNVTGHLKLLCNGYYHLLNKTTGAIVSQDVPAVLSGGVYSLVGSGYVTQNGAVALGSVSVSPENITFFRLSGNSGLIGTLTIPTASVSFPAYKLNKLNYIDHDKIFVGDGLSTSAVVSVAEYDKFIEALYEYNV